MVDENFNVKCETDREALIRLETFVITTFKMHEKTLDLRDDALDKMMKEHDKRTIRADTKINNIYAIAAFTVIIAGIALHFWK